MPSHHQLQAPASTGVVTQPMINYRTPTPATPSAEVVSMMLSLKEGKLKLAEISSIAKSNADS
jgi:hypothetical protein